MDIYIKGHKDLTVASMLTPVELAQSFTTHADIEHSYTGYGGYIGYAYVDSYSYHLCVGQNSYVGYTYVPIKLSYNKSYISYVEQTVPINYDVYQYQLDEYVADAVTRGGGGEEEPGGEVEPEEPGGDPIPSQQVPQYVLSSDVITRSTSARVYTPIVRDDEVSYEYNAYTSYSYSYAYLASYSYFHHDWNSYSYSYSYTAYSFDSYLTVTTCTQWVPSLSTLSSQYSELDDWFDPYQYINPDEPATGYTRE